jgi:hypothetical protein
MFNPAMSGRRRARYPRGGPTVLLPSQRSKLARGINGEEHAISQKRTTAFRGAEIDGRKVPFWVNFCRAISRSARLLYPGEFNRSTQHRSLERTDCWCRSNFSIKSQDIRHRSRSFERLRRYPPILAALPALSALCLQLRHEPCPCMSLYMHAIPTWRIRVKGCCVDRLNSPPQSCHADDSPWGKLRATRRHTAARQRLGFPTAPLKRRWI